jgi:hypothetical protein
MPPANVHGCYDKKHFEEHVACCDGELHKKLSLNSIATPYIPHIQKNKIFAFLMAHNRLSEYQYIKNYITYDFETVMKKTDVKYGSKSHCSTELYPLSVARTCRINENVTTKSKYVANARFYNQFINEWINELFTHANQINIDRVAYIECLNLPKNITETIKYEVKVIGYNSKKFDVNVFINYINSQKIKIKKVLGSTTQYKLMVISHKDYDFDLHFIDLCSFLSGG